MALNTDSGEFIALTEAQDYVRDFRAKYPGFPKGFFAGSDHVKQILSQDDCIGIRIYYGYSNKEESANLVIVGVDSKEKDLTGKYILERLTPCPNACDSSSPLFNP